MVSLLQTVLRRSGSRRRQSLVASKPVLQPQQGSHGVLFRQLGCAPALMTSTFRTARCGPACRVVWQGRGQPPHPDSDSDRIFAGLRSDKGPTRGNKACAFFCQGDAGSRFRILHFPACGPGNDVAATSMRLTGSERREARERAKGEQSSTTPP